MASSTKKPRRKAAKKKPGRPAEAIPKRLAQSLLDWIARGNPLTEWCEGARGRPSPRTVRLWKQKDPGFAAAYREAREDGAHTIAERMRELAHKPLGRNGSIELQQRKLIIDTDKWLLGRWFPTHYGDRMALAGDKDSPLHTPPQTDQEAARAIALLMARAATRKMKAKK